MNARGCVVCERWICISVLIIFVIGLSCVLEFSFRRNNRQIDDGHGVEDSKDLIKDWLERDSRGKRHTDRPKTL